MYRGLKDSCCEYSICVDVRKENHTEIKTSLPIMGASQSTHDNEKPRVEILKLDMKNVLLLGLRESANLQLSNNYNS